MLVALKQVWLNKERVAMIILLQKLKELCHMITYDSKCNRVLFICHTQVDNIVLKNNRKGMPYLDLDEFEVGQRSSVLCAEAALSFVVMVQGNI